MDFNIEAVYYLEQHDYDFKKALQEYKKDLQAELDLAAEMKKSKKKKKRVSNSNGNI